MRVAIDGRRIADYGIGTYIRGLLDGLRQIAGQGDQYVVLAGPEARALIPFEHVVMESPHYSVRELVEVGRTLRRVGADVFHAPHYVLPFTSTPSVVTIHDLIHLRVPHRNILAPAYARAMLGRAVRRSARVLTVSETVRRDIESTFGVSGVVVTPNGVEARFNPDGPRREGNYFLYVGNDKPHKNVERLIDAATMLRPDLPPFEMVLAGASFDRFGDRATCAGFVAAEELPALYRGAMALVMPSLQEGFGLPVLEAMACGTPVITSMAEALLEVTADAAIHVDARDVKALASAMRSVALDEDLRRSMSVRGRERASAFTWRRCAERTHAIYQQVAARSGARVAGSPTE